MDHLVVAKIDADVVGKVAVGDRVHADDVAALHVRKSLDLRAGIVALHLRRVRQGYADRLHVVGALGGPEGFASLRDTAAAMGAALYPDIDLQYVYRNSPFDSYNVRRDTARFLIRTTAAVYPYNPATFALDTQARPRYLISPRRYGSLFASFGSAYAAFSCTGVSLRSVGRDLAADYREGQAVDRQTALDGLTEALDGLDAYSLLVENGNAYTLPRSSHVVELPMDSCGYDATDESVPFLQLVVSG